MASSQPPEHASESRDLDALIARTPYEGVRSTELDNRDIWADVKGAFMGKTTDVRELSEIEERNFLKDAAKVIFGHRELPEVQERDFVDDIGEVL